MTVTFGQTEGGGGSPFVPSEDWIEAFEAQANPELYTRLKRYARSRGGMVAHAGRVVDELYIDELVQDALDDVFDGVLRWDPARGSLELFLIAAIHSRTRHDYAHALRFRHERIDASEGALAAAEASLAGRESMADTTERVLVALRACAVRDPDVLALLALYGQHVTKKVDVMRDADWSSKRYEAARKRMLRLVQQLPNELRVRT
jgi:hypothetical protein